MKNYDLNIIRGTHTVKVTLQSFESKGYFTMEIGGNCHGGSIIEHFTNLEDNLDDDNILENECNLELSENDEGEYWFNCILHSPDGEKDYVEDELACINNYIVRIELIDYRED